MQRPTREELRQLYDSGPEATIAFIENLFDIIESLSEQVSNLEARIKTLEDQLAKQLSFNVIYAASVAVNFFLPNEKQMIFKMR